MDKNNNSLSKAKEIKNIQLENDIFATENGIIKKIFIENRYFYIYTNNNINYDKKINLFIFCHGSRDIAMNCILTTTNLISTFGSNENWIVVFGQCDGEIQEPTIHNHFKKIGFGELYWKITSIQNKQQDIEYIKQIVEFMETKYKLNKKVIMGHSNGGVFCLLMAIYLPNIFDAIISHQGGIGWDPYFTLDFDLIVNNTKKPKLLFYTGTLDGHKSPCEIAHNIFIAEKYYSEIIIIEKLEHNYEVKCENIIKNWIENNI